MTEQHITEPGGEFTFERLWALFQETDREIRENAQRQKETDRGYGIDRRT
jgi:hypothetical protein